MKYPVKQLINDNGNPAANIVLSTDWEYSKTTMKHLYIFLRQNGYYNLSSAKDVRKAIKEGWVTLKKVESLNIV